MATGDLVTLAELKERIESAQPGADELLQTVISAASAAIRVHTGREFAGPASAETRTFDVAAWPATIGDVRSLNVGAGAVVVKDADGLNPTSYASTDWILDPVARPADEPARALRPASLVAGTVRASGVVSVTALWGWPAIPAPVKEACIQTCRSWLRQDAERFAGVIDEGTGYVVAPTPAATWMLPLAAKQLLQHYRIRGVA